MLRQLAESDLDQCTGIFVSTFAQPPWNEKWERQIVRQPLDQLIKTPASLGVVIGDTEIRGFALGVSEPWHEGTHFFLKEMCVVASSQRAGLGTQLMEFLISELQARDTRRIYLLTARGEMAESFYSKQEFYASSRMILMGRRSE